MTHQVIDNPSEYITAVERQFYASERDGKLALGVSGGSAVEVTAAALERLFKGGSIKKVDIFFCDERIVPVDDVESIYGAYNKKSSQMSSDFCTFHPVKISHSNPALIAEDYQKTIEHFFKAEGISAFDTLLLGMGDDGHTCSLFPGHSSLEESTKLVIAEENSPKPPSVRVSMTFSLINNAKNVMFLVRGSGKAEAVRQILKKEAGFDKLPAGRVAKSPTWLLDSAAASKL